MLPPVPGGSAAALVAYLVGTILVHTMTFEFGNGGSVRVDDPLRFQPQTGPLMTLVDPKFLGAGGGGAVFSYSVEGDGRGGAGGTVSRKMNTVSDGSNSGGADKVVVKYSWLKSAESVRNECNILRAMEERQVHGVERCLGSAIYSPHDPERVIIVMQPLMDDTVSSLGEVASEAAASRAVLSLMKTMAQMLVAGVVTTDVQPLISRTTGEAVLIDMTEATVVEEPLTDIDRALIVGFCTEMISLIPERLLEVASKSFQTEMMDRIERSSSLASPSESSAMPHRPLAVENGDFREILRALPLATNDLLEYLEK